MFTILFNLAIPNTRFNSFAIYLIYKYKTDKLNLIDSAVNFQDACNESRKRNFGKFIESDF